MSLMSIPRSSPEGRLKNYTRVNIDLKTKNGPSRI